MLNLSLNSRLKTVWAGLLVLAVVSFTLAGPSGSIEGLLLGQDDRPADRFHVVLISASGEELAASALNPHGLFRFDPVPTGSYGLGVRSVDGQAAPVMSVPIEVDGRKVVRNIRLRTATAPASLAPASGGVGVWWAGLSPAAEVWAATGGLMIVGLTFAAVDEDDDPGSGESPVTPVQPLR
jgi:hypothetical protein